MRLVLKAAIVAATFMFAAAADAAEKPKPLFADDAPIAVTLSGPIYGMSRIKGAKALPGTLTVDGATPETLPVMLTTRGITRRKREICSFPPLRVEFAQKPAKTSLFRGQKHLKLVTHCQEADKFEQNLLLEYSAYHLYRILTPQSFNVRLATVNYRGDDGHLMTTKLGFFLEDIDDVAKRNGEERLRGATTISPTQLEATSAARFAVFEYIISNLDWAMTAAPVGDDCCHNSRLLGAPGSTTALVPIPYDFDYSGFIDAPYAAVPLNMGVANVRQRLYRGFCRHNDEARAAVADMVAHRAQMVAVLDQLPKLSDRTHQKAANFLGDSFDMLASPQKVDDMLKNCLR